MPKKLKNSKPYDQEEMNMSYKFEVIETSEQPALSVRTVTSVDRLPAEIGRSAQVVIDYLNEVGEQPSDALYVAYYNMDMQKLDVEIGFPVKKVLEGRGEVCKGTVPAGKKATCMYKGPYKEMEPAYGAMSKWMEENGHQPTGIMYEYYYNSPDEVPESELLTKIVYLLK
jgi:effector-binding domain-containing protein